jgi:hypothetical protein
MVGRWGRWLLIEVDANVIEPFYRFRETSANLIVEKQGKRPTCKTSAIDVLYAMVGDKESFLPPHKNSPTVVLGHGQVWSL